MDQDVTRNEKLQSAHGNYVRRPVREVEIELFTKPSSAGLGNATFASREALLQLKLAERLHSLDSRGLRKTHRQCVRLRNENPIHHFRTFTIRIDYQISSSIEGESFSSQTFQPASMFDLPKSTPKEILGMVKDSSERQGASKAPREGMTV